ncbi:ankyrin repeat domain-containing protein, partial [bacterium]
ALHMAAAKGHAETCRLLVAAGADLRIEDQRGRSPLDVCRSDQLRGLLVSEAERLALECGLATPTGKSATHRI